MENKEDLKKLIKKISELLKNINHTNNIVKYYWQVGRLAEELIINAIGEECDLPIDIELIAKKLDITIEEEELNIFENKHILRMNRKIAQLVIRKDIFSGDKKFTIYVDKSAPPSSRRYAIANEIAHYLLHKGEESYYENYFIMPMCPKNIEEIAADIFSVFLLIPMRVFFSEFAGYVQGRVERQRIPITTEDWMRYLSERAVLSEYYVAYGYQYLRAVGYWVYHMKQRLNEDENHNMDENEDHDINENENMTEEEKNEISIWIAENFLEDEERYLFQE